MKKLLITSVLAVAATTANAGNILGANDLTIGSPYVGVKAGAVQFKANSTVQDFSSKEEAGSLGIYGGVELFGGMGAEVSYQKSNKVDSDKPILQRGGVDAYVVDAHADKLDLMAFYKVHPVAQSPIYLKGKLGYSRLNRTYEKLNLVNNNTGTTRTEDISTKERVTGVGYGLGVGYQFNKNIGAEVTYDGFTAKQGRGNAALTAGIHYKF